MAVGSTPNGGHKPMCADLTCQMFSCMCMHLLIHTPIVHTGMHPTAPQSTLVVTLIFGMLYLISHCCMDFLLPYSYRLPA